MRVKTLLMDRLGVLGSNRIRNAYHMLTPVRRKSQTSTGRKATKKVYFREEQLDEVMDRLQKPHSILTLKDIIQSHKNLSVNLRDLEKEVGFVRKWNLMAAIEKNPKIFYVNGGVDGRPVSVTFTDKARSIAEQENDVWTLMEPILVTNLRKLLMLAVDTRIPMENIELFAKELGLPKGFKNSLIPKYPHFFSMKDIKGRDYLYLESWDSSLAVTAREKLAQKLISENGVQGKHVRISKDGNYLGPHAFRIRYHRRFRPNKEFLARVEKWQMLEFPSPYLNARRFDQACPRARKRAVGVIHELMSLTMSKRMTTPQMHALSRHLYLPARLILCLVKHQGIFYITNKGVKSTVFLKEAYNGIDLIDKCPMLRFNEKFVSLSGIRGRRALCHEHY